MPPIGRVSQIVSFHRRLNQPHAATAAAVPHPKLHQLLRFLFLFFLFIGIILDNGIIQL